MMLKVLFFARLREELETGQLDVELSQGHSVDDLITCLCERGGESWRGALGADNLVIAVNQRVSTRDQGLEGGDEIAFFPPMTGG